MLKIVYQVCCGMNVAKKHDALWLVDLYKHGLLHGSFILPKNIMELRDLMFYRFKLTKYYQLILIETGYTIDINTT